MASEKLRTSLLESRDIVERNIGMVRLRTEIRGVGNWADWCKKEADSAALLSFYEKMEFGVLADELRQPTLF